MYSCLFLVLILCIQKNVCFGSQSTVVSLVGEETGLSSNPVFTIILYISSSTGIVLWLQIS